jgi:hypothetical protein
MCEKTMMMAVMNATDSNRLYVPEEIDCTARGVGIVGMLNVLNVWALDGF